MKRYTKLLEWSARDGLSSCIAVWIVYRISGTLPNQKEKIRHIQLMQVAYSLTNRFKLLVTQRD